MRPRWLQTAFEVLLPVIAAGVISWVTSVYAVQTKTAILEERQHLNFSEMQRTLTEIREDVRELRRERRDR